MATVKTEDLQSKILDIFKQIDMVCKKNNIRYYAIGGTCLGAVRHKGFIPWDDDIDIAMPRKDYDKFIEIAEKYLPDNLRIFHVNDVVPYDCVFIKVHDVNTTLLESSFLDIPERYTGIFVDVMPLDGLPENWLFRKIYFIKVKILLKLNINRRFEVVTFHKGMALHIWKLAKLFLDRFPYDFFFNRLEKMKKKYDFDHSKYSCYGWALVCNKIVFPTKDFREGIYMDFEDYKMCCPNGYDNFLKIMFGEYMELPPEDQRKPAHTAVVDLKTSYLEYWR